MDSSFFFTTVAAAISLFTLLRRVRFHQDNKENDSSSSSPPPSSSLFPSPVPPPSSSLIWTHHVFPSFRGDDVRRDFLSHIQMEFERKGISTFIDNEIKRGKSIGPELIQAIRESKIAVILLSRNYASSKWCLDELVEIMKCREEFSQTVLTIFYKVDPSDVKKLTGDFGKVFKKTCAGKTKECIGRWRRALSVVATTAGYHSNNWDSEAAMIKQIAIDISNKLNNSITSNDFDGLVGMRSHLVKMKPLLCLESDEVRMVGIWGPPGIGKTTIARVLYNQLSNNFQLATFVDNIKAKYTNPCSDDYNKKLYFHQQFMSQITNHKDMEVSHLGVVQDRLKDKKVLIVLDGVDKSVQLDAMAKETSWFGPKSRIIITSQDHKLLRAHGVEHIYKVNLPEYDEAKKMFCMYAFGQEYPKDGFEMLVGEVTILSGELPLGLRVLGCYFKGMSKKEWKMSIPRLKTSLDTDIHSILKFSYDALDDEDKNLFLHIACLFNGEKIKRVEDYLATQFLEMRQRLNFLADKSLISLDDYCGDLVVDMHTFLEKLGIEIVRKQSIHEPGQRQFLIDEKEIREVLSGDAEGSKKVIGIKLYYNKEEFVISERAFEGMSNLRFLICHSSQKNDVGPLKLPQGLNYLSRKLRILEWSHLPLTCLPSYMSFEFLVKLELQWSELEKLWEGIKSLRSLKIMDLSYSRDLKELPDLSTATNLLDLNLNGCISLIELPSSIENLQKLKTLSFNECFNLSEIAFKGMSNLKFLEICASKYQKFAGVLKLPQGMNYLSRKLRVLKWSHLSLTCLPSTVSFEFLVELALKWSELEKLWEGNKPLRNLKIMDLSGSRKLRELPDLSTATNLLDLYLSGCISLVELPSSIGYAKGLKKLILSGCSELIKFPSGIENATDLEILYLNACTKLLELPSFICKATNLKVLDLNTLPNLLELPSSIGNLTSLERFYCDFNSNLRELPSSIGNLISLKILSLNNCSNLLELPSSIGNLTNLEKLYLHNCSNLLELPSSIGNLRKLETLSLYGCLNLRFVPAIINLKSLCVFSRDYFRRRVEIPSLMEF